MRSKTDLFSSKAEMWKVDRKTLNPLLNPKIMNNFMPKLNEAVQIFTDQFETEPFDIYNCRRYQ
jgi:cytochrome P450